MVLTKSESEKFSNTNIIGNGTKNKVLIEDSPIHSWYQFVLGYPPHLVQCYLKKFEITSENVVLDPFCGTGTTPVECLKMGVPCYGIEANRMAYFASNVKTNLNLSPDDLNNWLGFIFQSSKLSFKSVGIKDNISFFTDLPSSKALKEIKKIPVLDEDQLKIIPEGFISEKPLKKILILKEIIDNIEESNIQNFFTLSLANLVVKKAGNIAFGPEIHRTAPKEDIEALSYFVANSNRMITELDRFKDIPQTATIIHGDSRNIDNCLHPNLIGKINCIITSPPYPNEKDYTRSTRLESVLLGFIKDKQDLRRMKEGLLRSNSRNIYCKDTDGDCVNGFDSIRNIADAIENRRIILNKTSGFERLYHKIVRHYFGGMYQHLKSLKPYLSNDARLAYVVGDQMSFFQTHIPTAQILGEIAESLDYQIEDIDLWRTRLATATKLQIDENVLILRNV